MFVITCTFFQESSGFVKAWISEKAPVMQKEMRGHIAVAVALLVA